MRICECILSDNTVKHVEILQKIICMNSDSKNSSNALDMLLRYVVAELDNIPKNDFIIIDDYFSKHPAFLNAFYTDIMMSATFHSN